MSDINFVGGIIMKLREVLKIISILSNLKEGEKIYLSNKRGYILKTGKFCGFDENKNIIYEPKYTKEEFTEIQYNIALDILMGIEIAHKLLNCVPDMPNIDLYNSDISGSMCYGRSQLMKPASAVQSAENNILAPSHLRGGRKRK